MRDSGVPRERPGVVQRALEIAKSGTVADIAALNIQLAAEGYADSPRILAGRSLQQQLNRMILEAGGGR
jgi:hypothetical protein